MANLSLRQRRMLSRGISLRVAKAWGNRVFMSRPGTFGNRAVKTFGTGNSAFDVFSRVPGTQGNTVKFAVVVPAGAGAAPSVAVTGTFAGGNAVVTFNSATAGAGVASSTVNDMVRLVNADPNARPLVHVQRSTASDGTGIVAAAAATLLAGAV